METHGIKVFYLGIVANYFSQSMGIIANYFSQSTFVYAVNVNID